MKTKEYLNIVKLEKEIKFKEIEILETKKIKKTRLNYVSFDELNKKSIADKRSKLVEALWEYKKYKDGKKNITMKEIIKIHRLNIHLNTFSRHWKYFKINGVLKNHGNLSRVPKNKISKETENMIINKYFEIMNIIYNHHKDERGNSKALILVTHLHKEVLQQLKKEHPLKNELQISYTTFLRRLTILEHVGRKTHKKTKSLIRRAIRLRIRLKQMKENYKKLNKTKKAPNKEETYIVVQGNKTTIESKKEIKKRLEGVLPGQVVEADGSFDLLYKGNHICRTQITCSKTNYCMGIGLALQETNKSYLYSIRTAFKHGIPLYWYGDKRKGVDPTDPGALIGLILSNFGVVVIANSNSYSKAVVESGHGPAHSFFELRHAVDSIKTLQEAKKSLPKNIEKLNEINGHPVKPDFSHLKQMSKQQKEFLCGDIDKAKIVLTNGISYDKIPFSIRDDQNNVVSIARNEFVLISKINSTTYKLMFNRKIYNLVKITDEVKISNMNYYEAFEKIKDRTFIKNDAAIINNETLQYLLKESFINGLKIGIKKRKSNW